MRVQVDQSKHEFENARENLTHSGLGNNTFYILKTPTRKRNLYIFVYIIQIELGDKKYNEFISNKFIFFVLSHLSKTSWLKKLNMATSFTERTNLTCFQKIKKNILPLVLTMMAGWIFL